MTTEGGVRQRGGRGNATTGHASKTRTECCSWRGVGVQKPVRRCKEKRGFGKSGIGDDDARARRSGRRLFGCELGFVFG